jgi:hypothetical protein
MQAALHSRKDMIMINHLQGGNQDVLACRSHWQLLVKLSPAATRNNLLTVLQLNAGRQFCHTALVAHLQLLDHTALFQACVR